MMRFILFAVAIVLAGCAGSGSGGDQSPTAPSANVAGVYQLVSINGAGLPADLSGVYNAPGGTAMLRLISESMVLLSSGTYTTTATEAVWNGRGYGPSSIVTSSGTYTASGSTVGFTDAIRGTGSGSVSGNTMTVRFGNQSMVFAR